LAALLETKYYKNEKNLRKTFDIFDLDKNGVLSLHEIKMLFGGDKCIYKYYELQAMFNKIDTDKSG